MSSEIGRITIIYMVEEDGMTTTDYNVDGEIPLVVSLGLLDLTRDSMLMDTREDNR